MATHFQGKVGHLEGIESPWANAGGLVKKAEDAAAMAGTGVGWIEAGSFTLELRVGNAVDPDHPETSKRVYWHDAKEGATYNSLGMPNPGMDAVEKEIPEMANIAHKAGKKLVVNVAPVSDEPASESVELVRRAYAAGSDAVLLNAGCPNVVTEDGSRHELLSRNPEALTDVLTALWPVVDKYMPIFVRISPQETPHDMHVILRRIVASGIVSAVFLPNTWPGFVPLDANGAPVLQVPGGAGGKSGPAMRQESLQQLDWAGAAILGAKAKNALSGKQLPDLVMSSGITEARTLQKAMELGAVAGAGTTYFWEAGNWQTSTDRLLSNLAEL